MREILFRAKRIDNGEWVEGFYSQLPKPSFGATIITNGDLCAEDVSDYIIVNQCKQHSNFSNGYPLEVVECEYYEIDSETLCQYTGMNDKNGKRIWENDIVRCNRREKEAKYKVVWDKTYADFRIEKLNGLGCMPICIEEGNTPVFGRHYECIGNVFDNPELLKKQ